MADQIDAALRGYTDSGRIPGVVAVALDDGGVRYSGAFGKRALPDGADMTVDSVFWIASMTKALTSVAALQLVERGKVGLDQPAAEVVAELADANVLEGWDDDGTPRLRAPRGAVTLRQLLTHTSGFSYEFWSDDIVRYQKATGTPGIISCAHRALTTPMLFDPGEGWEYGISTDWVGRVVEELSSRRLEDYLRDELLVPLGMTDTAFTLRPDLRDRLVTMHQRAPDGGLEPIAYEIPQDPEFHMGGGGLYGTAHDYARFLRALLRGGELDGVRILKADTVALMARNHIGELNVETLRTALPHVTNDADFYPDMVEKWGLGFLINTEETEQGRSPNSLAWAGLGNTYFWADPARRVGGVILAQLFPFADEQVLAAFHDFESGVYASLRGVPS